MVGTKLSTHSAECKYKDKHKETAKEKKVLLPKEKNRVCRTPSVITLCLHTAWSCDEELSLESKRWSYPAELMTEYLLSAAYGNPICPYLTVYDLFALQVLQSAQGSVKQTQNPFIG